MGRLCPDPPWEGCSVWDAEASLEKAVLFVQVEPLSVETMTWGALRARW